MKRSTTLIRSAWRSGSTRPTDRSPRLRSSFGSFVTQLTVSTEALAYAGGYLAPPSSADSWLAGAVRRCQKDDPEFPRVTAYSLRHTAASLAISAGANPKVVQRMLGHASAAMTLDVYADLFDSDLATVAESVAKLWPRHA